MAASVAAYDPNVDDYARYNHRRLEASFQRFAERLPAQATVLDAGCGPGRDLSRLVSSGHLPIGVDLSATFIARASSAAPVALGDLRVLPFRSAAFDAVWASASLVHLPTDDTRRALREMVRVARPGAPAYLSVRCVGETGWYDIWHGRRWFRIWDPDELISIATAAGLIVDDVTYYRLFVELWTRVDPERAVDRPCGATRLSAVSCPTALRSSADPERRDSSS